MQSNSFSLQAIGIVRSPLKNPADAPKQGGEGAPEAWIELKERFLPALLGMKTGQEILLITWLHQAKRDILQNHPRADKRRPLSGVFSTRSPHRPNPLGLHRVSVRAIEGNSLLVFPLEAIDGTPVVDIKSVSHTSDYGLP
ncbi:MAG: tRNA (N6-threonylcarbamoyladenosine(37)-N6)-methyltransferase TrmO [Desulfobulbaceae bacterium]|nr:tRNA (N6-threonylcarbamoyladenosine(37)-N6)-methyltransferase TrmO [Desulfobulbaceae bacterium]